MSHNQVFGVCESKCFVPVSPKTEVDELTETVNNLSLRASSEYIDNNGNIWLVYNAVYNTANNTWTKPDTTKKSTALCLDNEGILKPYVCNAGSSTITWAKTYVYGLTEYKNEGATLRNIKSVTTDYIEAGSYGALNYSINLDVSEVLKYVSSDSTYLLETLFPYGNNYTNLNYSVTVVRTRNGVNQTIASSGTLGSESLYEQRYRYTCEITDILSTDTITVNYNIISLSDIQDTYYLKFTVELLGRLYVNGIAVD